MPQAFIGFQTFLRHKSIFLIAFILNITISQTKATLLKWNRDDILKSFCAIILRLPDLRAIIPVINSLIACDHASKLIRSQWSYCLFAGLLVCFLFYFLARLLACSLARLLACLLTNHELLILFKVQLPCPHSWFELPSKSASSSSRDWNRHDRSSHKFPVLPDVCAINYDIPEALSLVPWHCHSFYFGVWNTDIPWPVVDPYCRQRSWQVR